MQSWIDELHFLPTKISNIMASLTYDSCSKITATFKTWMRKSAVSWGSGGLDFEAGCWIATLDACLAGRMGIVDGCAGFVLKPMGSSGDASTVVMAVPVRKGLRPFWMMTMMRRQLLSHGCGCA
jgi:hypothetical protein